MRRNRTLYLVLVISSCLIAIVAFFLSVMVVSIPYFENGRAIVLYNYYYNNGFDYGGIAYQAWNNFSKVGRTCTIYNDTPIDYHFEAVYADKHEIIGIVDYGLFKDPLVMRDFKAGKCYPCDMDYKEAMPLFDLLQKENPWLEKASWWK
jgi:hypothetical protein